MSSAAAAGSAAGSAAGAGASGTDDAAPMVVQGAYPFTYLHFRVRNGPSFTDDAGAKINIKGFTAKLFQNYWHALIDEMWTEAARSGAVLRGDRLEWATALHGFELADARARLSQPLLTAELPSGGVTAADATAAWRGGPKQSDVETGHFAIDSAKAEYEYHKYARDDDSQYINRQSDYRTKLMQQLKNDSSPLATKQKAAINSELAAIKRNANPTQESIEKAHASLRPMGSAAFPPWILVPGKLRSPTYRWKMRTVGGRLVQGNLSDAEANGPLTYHDLQLPNMEALQWSGWKTDYAYTRALWRVTCLLWDLGVRMMALQQTFPDEYTDAFDALGSTTKAWTSRSHLVWPGTEPPDESGKTPIVYMGMPTAYAGPNLVLGDGSQHVPPLFRTIAGVPSSGMNFEKERELFGATVKPGVGGDASAGPDGRPVTMVARPARKADQTSGYEGYVETQAHSKAGWHVPTSKADCSATPAQSQLAPSWLLRVEDECERLLQLLGMGNREAYMRAIYGTTAEKAVQDKTIEVLADEMARHVSNMKVLWDGLGGDDAAREVWIKQNDWRNSVIQKATSPDEYQDHENNGWYGFDGGVADWESSDFRWGKAAEWSNRMATWIKDAGAMESGKSLESLMQAHSERVRALMLHWLRRGTTQAVEASIPAGWTKPDNGPMAKEVKALLVSECDCAVRVSGLGPDARPRAFDKCASVPSNSKKHPRTGAQPKLGRQEFVDAVAEEWKQLKNVITKMANRTNIDAKAILVKKKGSSESAPLVPGRPNTEANSQLNDGKQSWRSAFDREEQFYLTRLLGYSEADASALEQFETYGEGSSTIPMRTLARQLLRKWFSSYDPDRPRRWHATLNPNAKASAAARVVVCDDGTPEGQKGPPPNEAAGFRQADSDNWARVNRYGKAWPVLADAPNEAAVKAFLQQLQKMKSFGQDLQQARLGWAESTIKRLDDEAKKAGEENFDLATLFEQMPPYAYKGTPLWVPGYDIEQAEAEKMEAAAKAVATAEQAANAAADANTAAQNALNQPHESQDAAQQAQADAKEAAENLAAANGTLTFAKAQLELVTQQGAFPRLAFVYPKCSPNIDLPKPSEGQELAKLQARRTSLAAFVYFKQREAEMEHVYALHNFPIAHEDCKAHWRPWSTPKEKCALTFGNDVPQTAAELVRRPVVLRTRQSGAEEAFGRLHMYDFSDANNPVANKMFTALIEKADELKDVGLITNDQDIAIRAGETDDARRKRAMVYQAVINLLWTRPITLYKTEVPATGQFDQGTQLPEFTQKKPVEVPSESDPATRWVDYVKAWTTRRIIPRAWTRRVVKATLKPGAPKGAYAWTPANRQHPANYVLADQWTRNHPVKAMPNKAALPAPGTKLDDDANYLRSVYGPFMESLSGQTQELLKETTKQSGPLVTTNFSVSGSASMNPPMRLSTSTGRSYAARGVRWAVMMVDRLVDANCAIYAGEHAARAKCSLYDLCYWLYEHEPMLSADNPYAVNIKQWTVNNAQFAMYASTIWQNEPGIVDIGKPTVDVHGITNHGVGTVSLQIQNTLHKSTYDPTQPASTDLCKKYIQRSVHLLMPCPQALGNSKTCRQIQENHVLWKDFYAAPRLGREIQVIRGETIDMVSSFKLTNHVAAGAPFIPGQVRAGERFVTQSALSVSRNAPYVFTGATALLDGTGHTHSASSSSSSGIMHGFYPVNRADQGNACCLHLITLAKGMPILPLYLSPASKGGAEIVKEMEIMLPPNCEWEFLGATDVPRWHPDDVFKKSVTDAKKAEYKAQTVTAHCWFVRWRGVPRGGFPSKQPGGLGNKNKSTFASSAIHLGTNDKTVGQNEKAREQATQQADVLGGAQGYSDDEHLDWKAGATPPATQRTTLVRYLADLPNPTFDRPQSAYNEWYKLNRLYPARKIETGETVPATEEQSLFGKYSTGKH